VTATLQPAAQAVAQPLPASASPARLAGQLLGRFRLLAPLGRGAQASVWRALDERLQREVALKLMDGHAQFGLDDRWLHEAQAVGRLAHAHIVPVFEADVIDGQPMLVFELVAGQTLAQHLKERGSLPAREAVELMVGVVDALRAAHGQGIVHRDLKPSNILIDGEGRARVMDFGIAACWTDAAAGHDGLIAGSPGYLSPEAAAALPPSPQMDVFAAGLVLGELITGQPLLFETNAYQAVVRVQREDLLLSADAPVDDRLRAVLQRAIARDPAARYDSAASLRDALMQWLEPPDEALPESGAGHGTLDFLLRRMRYKSDFPAMSDGVLRIQRLANSDHETLQTLADEILKDVALTQKLLRLVNTAHFKRSGHSVSTVSRAVALVGMAGIRNLALSLVLVEHMKDKSQAQRLKECFLRALLAGQLAQALSASSREAEEAFLAALFYNLGPLLAEYYFPDEAQTVREQLATQARQSKQPGSGAARQAAAPHPDRQADLVAAQVLGLSYEALGVGVARHWGLPDSLQRCMRRPEGASPAARLPAGTEHMRWLAVAANEVADAVWLADGDDLTQPLDAVVGRHGRALGLSALDLRRATDQARSLIAEMAPAMGLGTVAGRRGRALLSEGVPPSAATVVMAPAAVTSAAAAMVGATPALAPQAVAAASEQAGRVLTAGIQDITDKLSGDVVKLNDVLRMVLETIHRAMACERVVFCLRDTGGVRMQGRFGLGNQATTLSALFQVPLKPVAGDAPDLFSAVCLKGNDVLIADRHSPVITKALPGWYRQHVASASFLLLPMQLRGAPFALIYADRGDTIVLSEQERGLLRTLRNQASMAFRQAGHS